MAKAQYLFGDIVVVEGDQIGVILKTWGDTSNSPDSYTYDVYVRSFNMIKTYPESEVERYRVRHKYLSDEELGWQAS